MKGKSPIKPFEQTTEKKAFAQQYVKATKLERFLKEQVSISEKKLQDHKQMLMQTQQGMALMIKHAEGQIINKQEKLDGMEGLE